MREPGGSVNTLRAPVELSTPVKVVLATLFVAAGAIHLAMAPIHAGDSTTEAIGFAIAGWLQIAIAIGIVVRPSWLVLGFGVIVQVAVRRRLDRQPHLGSSLRCTFGGRRVGRRGRPHVRGVRVGSGAPDSGGRRRPGASIEVDLRAPRRRRSCLRRRARAHFGPAQLAEHREPLAQRRTNAAGVAADGHVHGASASAPVTTLVVLPDPPNAPLLARQLAKARDVALQYPTVADATRAGMYRITPFIPGVGAEYVAGFNVGYADASNKVDLDHPLVYLYSGTGDTATVMGLVYYVFGPQPLPGFAGLDDAWLRRDGLCSEHVGDSKRLVAIDRDITQQDCADRGGTFASSVQWTLRVWAAPDWSNPAGPFRQTNPRVVCSDVPPPYSDDVMTFGCSGLS